MEEKTRYFETGGEACTDEALRIAAEYADAHNIKSIIVASTRGFTAEKAAGIFKGKNLIVVTHVHGFREPNAIEFSDDVRKKLETAGVKVITAAHAFGGISKLSGGLPGDLIASTLRMFSQGVKVAIECAAEAADAGCVSTDEDLVSIAGTGKGADTVLVLRPANTHRLFETKVKRVLAMPE
ncbi:MAG: pyruvate kinase alpha/beta domain-containing protein [Candidatus Aenigmatarchaeota archaeon]